MMEGGIQLMKDKTCGTVDPKHKRSDIIDPAQDITEIPLHGGGIDSELLDGSEISPVNEKAVNV